MTNKTKIIGLIIGLAGLAIAGTGALAVQAAQNGNGPQNFMADMASAIAQRFNLNTDDVQGVMNTQMQQQKAQTQEQREQTFENRLSQAVVDGKLTQAQADAIKAQKTSVQSQIDALKDKTPEERQAGMKAIMEAQKQWAKDNNIPQGYMMFGFGGVGKKMGWGSFGGPRGLMMQGDTPCSCGQNYSDDSD